MTMTFNAPELTVTAMREASARMPYQTPALVHYGDVRELTATGTGSKTETNPPGPGCSFSSSRKTCSDRRLKQNAVRIGSHALGFGLYLFDYKPQYQAELELDQSRQFGVMADEVELVMPQAVVVGSHGFKMVDYDMLGIQRTVH